MTLLAIIAVAALLLAGGIGYLVRGGSSSASPGVGSVDAGFARDMATHHTQAVSMAGIARDRSTDAAVKTLAFDIETSQQFQIGQLDGWLTAWGLGRTASIAPMAWMGHVHLSADGLMPGMASPTEMARLQTLSGEALDIDFLQLMLRHHQGGVPMAQYAAEHAEFGYVHNLAAKIVQAQSNEIITMEQMLRERGAAPLPAPQF
jgi:uncharacterized protein (DUF305 family)